MKLATRHRAGKLSALLTLGLFCCALAFADSAYESGEILVKFRANLDTTEIDRFVASYSTEIIEFDATLKVYRLRVPAGVTIDDLADTLNGDPRVEYAEPNYTGRGGSIVPDDTFLSAQWNLSNIGQTEGVLGADIEALDGWEFTTGSDTVVVAILDSGIDFNHPEFFGRLLPGYDFVNDDDDPTADHPHGLYVTGIIAANANNGFSVAGIDHSAMILPVKILDEHNLGSTSNLAKGLVYAADQGADVINMSLGDYPSSSRTLEDALAYARDAGAILISSAGNGGTGNADISGPGASPLTLSVGATDHRDIRWLQSATGAALDVVAPGIRVPTVSTEFVFDDYVLFSGTSAAAPIVSGITSLLLARNPDLTQEQVELVLKTTAEDQVGSLEEDTEGRDDFHGEGRVNMLAALQYAELPPESTIDSPGEDSSVVARDSIDFSGTCSDPLQTDSLTYDWRFEGDAAIDPVDTEDPGSLTFPTPGDVVVSFTCTDGFGRSDPTPAAIAITVTNSEPDGSIISPAGDMSIAQGGSIDFRGAASDPDGHLPLTFHWSFDGATLDATDENPGVVMFEEVGVYTVSFTVRDDIGAVDPSPETRTITVTNEAPNGEIVLPAGDMTIVAGESIEFRAAGSDPDGHEPLTFVWSFGDSAATSKKKNPGPILFETPGTYIVSLAVADSRGVVDATPDARVITVTAPPIPPTDGGEDDDEDDGGDGDGNSSGGDEDSGSDGGNEDTGDGGNSRDVNSGGGGGGSVAWAFLLFLAWAGAARRRRAHCGSQPG
jgi:thermitase